MRRCRGRLRLMTMLAWPRGALSTGLSRDLRRMLTFGAHHAASRSGGLALRRQEVAIHSVVYEIAPSTVQMLPHAPGARPVRFWGHPDAPAKPWRQWSGRGDFGTSAVAIEGQISFQSLGHAEWPQFSKR